MARVKRPVLDREAPLRSWTSATNAGGAGSGERANPPQSDRLESSDPVVRGVVSGNRVVEDWIRQAQHTARLLGGGAATSGWADASGRLARTASDAIAAWTAMLGMGVPGAGTAGQPDVPRDPPGQTPPPRPATHGNGDVTMAPPQTTANGAARITIAVSSRRPASITVDLHKDGVTSFRVFDLRPERGRARRIRGVQLTSANGDGLHLNLAVPDDQPPGTYHAVIVDSNADCAVGTITLRLS